MTRIDEIKQCVVENFAPDVSPEDLPDEFDLLDSGMVSSLSLVKLITLLDRRFDLNIDAADVRPDDFRSVAAIDEFIHNALARSRA